MTIRAGVEIGGTSVNSIRVWFIRFIRACSAVVGVVCIRSNFHIWVSLLAKMAATSVMEGLLRRLSASLSSFFRVSGKNELKYQKGQNKVLIKGKQNFCQWRDLINIYLLKGKGLVVVEGKPIHIGAKSGFLIMES